MHPVEELVAAFLAAQLATAEYASEHNRWLFGEVTFWRAIVGDDPRKMSKSELGMHREELRKEFDWFLHRDNKDGAMMLAEMAGMGERTIDAYIKSIRGRLSGEIKTLESEEKRKYVGVYPAWNKWYFRIQSKGRHIRYESRGFATEDEAMLARERMIDEKGYEWATRNRSG